MAKKRITFVLDEHLIRRAQHKARCHRKTLETLFREWLNRYADGDRIAEDYFQLMRRLGYATPGRSFARQEMNKR